MTRPWDPSGAASRSPRVALPWWVVPAGLAVIGLGGALVGVTAGDPGASAPATSSSAATPPAASSPSPGWSAPASTSPPTPSAVPSTTAAPTWTGVDFTMPDFVGLDLQSAQNAVQELGVLYSVSHDLVGSRNQVIDSNWIVCDQNVAPGQRVTGDVEGGIDFGVVKRQEGCP